MHRFVTSKILILISIIFLIQPSSQAQVTLTTELDDMTNWYLDETGITPNDTLFETNRFVNRDGIIYMSISPGGLYGEPAAGTIATLDSTGVNIIKTVTGEEGMGSFEKVGDRYIIPGADPSGSDGWDAGNVYTYDSDTDVLTKKRYRYSSEHFVDSTTTDAQGVYTFSGLKHTSYFLKFIVPADYRVTSENVGADESIDSDVEDNQSGVFPYLYAHKNTCDSNMHQLPEQDQKIYLEPGSEYNVEIDAGYRSSPGTSAVSPSSESRDETYFGDTMTISGTVWFDADSDGIRDGGETLASGYRVELYTHDPYLPCTVHASITYKDDENNIYILGSGDYGAWYKSDDLGEDWSYYSKVFDDPYDATETINGYDRPLTLLEYEGHFYIPTEFGQIYESTDFLTWTPMISSPLYGVKMGESSIWSVAGYGDYLYFAYVLRETNVKKLGRINTNTLAVNADITPSEFAPGLPNSLINWEDKLLYMIGKETAETLYSRVYASENGTDWTEVAYADSTSFRSIGYWSETQKLVLGTRGATGGIYTINEAEVRAEYFPNIVFPDPVPTPKFKKDTRCHWTRPSEIEWIKAVPTVKDGKKGIELLWTQYGADKVNIKIDDGSGNFPWEIKNSLNDGHQFIENVGTSQQLRIQGINHCKEGSYNEPFSYELYPEGKYD